MRKQNRKCNTSIASYPEVYRAPLIAVYSEAPSASKVTWKQRRSERVQDDARESPVTSSACSREAIQSTVTWCCKCPVLYLYNYRKSSIKKTLIQQCGDNENVNVM